MTRASIDDQLSENGYETAEKLEGMLRGSGACAPEESSALQTRLRECREIQIKAADAELWAASGLDTALCTAERIQKSLRNAMDLFHSDRRVEAIKFFGRCLEGLERFHELVTGVRCAMKLDFNRIETQGRKLCSIEADLLTLLATLTDLQEKMDFETLADTVEDEVLTNLGCWIRGLRSLSLSASSHA